MAATLEIIIKATDKASAELKSVSDKMGGLGSIAKTAATAIGAVGAAAGIMAAGFKLLVQPAIDYGLQVKDLASKIGTTAEVASTWIQVADDMRINMMTMNTAFRQLSKDGIQPTIENIGKLADQYNAISSPVAKAQFAMKTFGARAGPEMQRLLAMGSAGLRDLAASAAETGLVIDDLQAQKMQAMFNRMDEFGDRVEGLKMKIGFALADTLMKAQDAANQGLLVLGHALGLVSDAAMVAAANQYAEADAINSTTDAAEDLSTAMQTMTENELIRQAAIAYLEGDYAKANAFLAQYQAVRDYNGQIDALIERLKRLATMDLTPLSVAERAQSGKIERGETEGWQHGGTMMVPPGFPNDSYPMWVSSGERVTVQTPEQQRTGGGAGVNIGQVVINNGLDEQGFALMMKRTTGQ